MATTVWDGTSLLTNPSGGLGNRNNREEYDAAIWTNPGSGFDQIRFTIVFGATCDGSYTHGPAYFGVRGASGPNFDGTQTQVTWAGGNSTMTSTPGGSTVVSDWISLPANFDSTQNYIFAIFNGPISGNVHQFYGSVSNGVVFEENTTGSSTSSQTTPSNFGGGGAGTLTIVTKIEVQSSGISINLTGAGVTAAAGALTPKDIEALTGIGITSAAGTFPPPLASIGITSAAGSFAKSITGTITGAGATPSAGAFVNTITDAITGVGATTAAGSWAKTIVEPFTGSGVTAAAGSLTSANFNLIGVNAASGAGSFAKQVIVGLPGTGLVIAAAGTDITEIVLASLDTGMAIAAGTLVRTVPLSGIGLSSGAGIFVFLNVPGAPLTSGAGSFARAITSNTIPGIGLVTSSGNFTKIVLPTFTGAGVTAAPGMFGLAPSLVGAGVVASADLFSVSGVGSFTLTGAGATATAGIFGLAPSLVGAGVTSASGTFIEVVAPTFTGAGVVVTPGVFNVTTNSGVTVALIGAGVTGSAGSFARAVIEPFSGAGATLSPGSFSASLSGSAALPGIGITTLAGLLGRPMAGVSVVALAAPLPTWAIRPTLASANMITGAGFIPTSAGSFTFVLPSARALMSAGTLLVTVTHILPVLVERIRLVSTENRSILVPVYDRPIIVIR